MMLFPIVSPLPTYYNAVFFFSVHLYTKQVPCYFIMSSELKKDLGLCHQILSSVGWVWGQIPTLLTKIVCCGAQQLESQMCLCTVPMF